MSCTICYTDPCGCCSICQTFPCGCCSVCSMSPCSCLCSVCNTDPCYCLMGPVINGRLPPCPEAPACACARRPCICGQGHFQMQNMVNPNKNCCTLCSGDIQTPNVWFQKKPEYFHQGVGRCILDELTFGEVYTVLIRNPSAKKDLLRITRDPDLVALAVNSRLSQDPLEADLRATNIINKGPNALPIYTLFNGNIDGSIGQGGNRRKIKRCIPPVICRCNPRCK
jgi:hypothetical protein